MGAPRFLCCATCPAFSANVIRFARLILYSTTLFRPSRDILLLTRHFTAWNGVPLRPCRGGQITQDRNGKIIDCPQTLALSLKAPRELHSSFRSWDAIEVSYDWNFNAFLSLRGLSWSLPPLLKRCAI